MCLFFLFQSHLVFSILKQSGLVTDINVCIVLNPVKFWISVILYGKDFHRPDVRSITMLTPFNIPISIMSKKDLLHFYLVQLATLLSEVQVWALWGRQGIWGC